MQGALIKESDFTPAFEGILSICTWLSEPIKVPSKKKKKKIKPFENKIIWINICDFPYSMRCCTECFTQTIELYVERPSWETVLKITNSMH